MGDVEANLEFAEGARRRVVLGKLQVLLRLLVISVHFEHKPEPQVDLIGTRKVRTDVQQLLEGFDRPPNF